jgi:hypothetical protein
VVTIIAGIGSLWTTRAAYKKGKYVEGLDNQIQGLEDLITEERRQAFQTELNRKQLEIEAAVKATEAEKIERLNLEKLVGPRRLSVEQQTRIGAACSGKTSKPINVGSYGMDGEGTALAIQIVSALRGHHLEIRPNLAGLIISGAFETGVVIRGADEDADFTGCLGKALQNIGHLEVAINGERHMAGAALMGGIAVTAGVAMSGGPGSVRPARPLPSGSQIYVFVGIKPIQMESAK